MNTLNLDIDTYTIFDLTQLFSLSSKYTAKDVTRGKDKLIHQLQRIEGVSPDKKLQIQFFIDNASTRLIHHKREPDKKLSWAQKENIMIPTGDGHYVIEDVNRVIGKHANTYEGRIGGTDDVPPGWLNPINVKSVKTGMNIDSRFRKDYFTTSSSDFSFDLPDIQKKVTNMMIASLDIPMSYYGVSRERGDSTFIITSGNTDYTAGSDSYLLDFTKPSNPTRYSAAEYISQNTTYELGWLVVLPDGNYEMEWQGSSMAEDITAAMNTALLNASPGLLFHTTGKFLVINDTSYTTTAVPITFSVDRASGRSIFTAGGTTDQFTLVFATNAGGSIINEPDLQLYLGWQLGFRRGKYNITADTPCISESICMVVGPRIMFIAIDDGVKNYGANLIVAFSQSAMQETVMTRINLTQTVNDTEVYKCAGDIGLTQQLNRAREYFGPVTISKLRFKLLDEYGRIISLNNMDWSITLVFEKLYD